MRIDKYKKHGLAHRRIGGFTLMELMIVVAIVGILASIAIPSYRQFLIRGHRNDAKAQMLDIANREQQFLLANRVYADKATLEANGYSLPAEVATHYNWNVAVGVGGMPNVTVTFTPIGGQVSDGPLTLDSQGNKTPADKWKN